MFSEIDPGVRCDRHVGEVFQVRCLDCDHLTLEAAAHRTEARLTRYTPGTECTVHPGYPLPCDRCARDRKEHHV